MTLYRIRDGSRVYRTTDTYVAAEASREGARVTVQMEARS